MLFIRSGDYGAPTAAATLSPFGNVATSRCGVAVRGFDASEMEVDLLMRGDSLPSGAGLRLFYRNQRLQEDDKWRQWY